MDLSIERLQTGSRVCIRVRGTCEQGTASNAYAREICEHIQACNKEEAVTAIDVDLLQFTYEFGDALVGVYQQLKAQGKGRRLLIHQDHAQAWNGLLSMSDPLWRDSQSPLVEFGTQEHSQHE